MPISEKLEQLKPYALGAVGGILATLIVSFSAGWVVTAGTMNEAVAQAKVQQLAAVCAQRAQAHWTSQNKDVAKLQGYEAWETRDELATQFAAGLPDMEAIEDEVVDECADLMSA